MSSIDSSLLSGSSYLTHNLYSNVLRPVRPNQKSQRSKGSNDCVTFPESFNSQNKLCNFTEYVLVFRLSIILLGLLATTISLTSSSIYGLWILAGDLGYVIVFPQFLAAVHFPHFVNPIGCGVASLVSLERFPFKGTVQTKLGILL